MCHLVFCLSLWRKYGGIGNDIMGAIALVSHGSMPHQTGPQGLPNYVITYKVSFVVNCHASATAVRVLKTTNKKKRKEKSLQGKNNNNKK